MAESGCDPRLLSEAVPSFSVITAQLPLVPRQTYVNHRKHPDHEVLFNACIFRARREEI